MEEAVGKLWHRFITGRAEPRYPEQVVRLKDVERTVGVLFRALGGDAGLRVATATLDSHNARRGWLARIGGVGNRAASARMDAATLRLPAEIDLFPARDLNRDLYLWLAALAAEHGAISMLSCEKSCDLLRNQAATVAALERWPGLTSRYRRLVEVYLSQRARQNPVGQLPKAEQAKELAIRRALEQPGSVEELPVMAGDMPVPQPVPLWLTNGHLTLGAAQREGGGEDGEQGGAATPPQDETRQNAYRAQREEMLKEKNGLSLMFRAESLLAVAEFLRINRPVDDEPDPDAADVARNLDQLSLAQDRDPVASRVRFDLDLPSAGDDDIVLGPGLSLPEWDYRKLQLLDDHVRIVEMIPRDAVPVPLPLPLRKTAQRLRRQFMALQPDRIWLRHQVEGSEVDVDAVVRAQTDLRAGCQPSDQVYLALQNRQRDLACMVLADLSLSTDTWVSSEQRVVDVIRDALLLFGEALCATGDRFAVCGFSSLKRSNVRFHRLKGFTENFDDKVRGRIAAIKPGYYTRLGAGIRRASQLLEKEVAARRVLLILSDGKPNDLDLYEGRYGIEDSRAAIFEARRAGLVPFCVTIDREGERYLPHLFGPTGYAVIRQSQELPARLPLLYAQLTR